MQDNTPFFKSIEEGGEAALAAKADIVVVVCASDDDYVTGNAPRASESSSATGDPRGCGHSGLAAPELEAPGASHQLHQRESEMRRKPLNYNTSKSG